MTFFSCDVPLDISPSLTAFSTTPILPTPSFISTLSLLAGPQTVPVGCLMGKLTFNMADTAVEFTCNAGDVSHRFDSPGQEDAWEGTATPHLQYTGSQRVRHDGASTQALKRSLPDHPAILFRHLHNIYHSAQVYC